MRIIDRDGLRFDVWLRRLNAPLPSRSLQLSRIRETEISSLNLAQKNYLQIDIENGFRLVQEKQKQKLWVVVVCLCHNWLIEIRCIRNETCAVNVPSFWVMKIRVGKSTESAGFTAWRRRSATAINHSFYCFVWLGHRKLFWWKLELENSFPVIQFPLQVISIPPFHRLSVVNSSEQ